MNIHFRPSLIALALSMGLMGLAPAAHAQAAAAAATAPASKKELVEKLLTLQRGLIEGLADGLVQQPAGQLVQQADMAIQTRVPPEKREEVANGVKSDVRKYISETGPIVRTKAIQAAPATIGVLLEEKFSVDELKQLIAILESPVNRKLNEMGPEMQQRLIEKILVDAKPEVEPKLRELQANVSKRFSAGAPQAEAPAASPAQAGSKAPAAKSSAPAGKTYSTGQ